VVDHAPNQEDSASACVDYSRLPTARITRPCPVALLYADERTCAVRFPRFFDRARRRVHGRGSRVDGQHDATSGVYCGG
jgi:hypothetical protein